MNRRPPRSTRTETCFPYTTLFRSDNIRYVATGYSSPFQIVVDADSPVQSVADLAGKRVGVLVGITAQEWFPRVAEVYGVKGKFEEFQLRAAELMTSLRDGNIDVRSEEHTSELQSLMRISYAVFCLKKTSQSH